MTPDHPPRAVLDTDIIFSRVLHELIGRIAVDLRLLTLIWSDELLAEARRVLVREESCPARVRGGELHEITTDGALMAAGSPATRRSASP